MLPSLKQSRGSNSFPHSPCQPPSKHPTREWQSTRYNPDNSGIINQLNQSINQLASQISSSSARPNVALPPPVKLEIFDGTDLTRWPAYQYQIQQLILHQSHLTEVEKAFHLRSSLRGAAFNLVASKPVHENFLAKIVARLESQYGRSNLSQAKLIQTLRSVRSKSTSTTDQLEAVLSSQ